VVQRRAWQCLESGWNSAHTPCRRSLTNLRLGCRNDEAKCSEMQAKKYSTRSQFLGERSVGGPLATLI
jgi:hypothetical protein